MTTISAILGVAWGAFMVSAAVDHNPQGVFIDTVTGDIDYLRLSAIFLSWAVAIIAAGLVAFFTIRVAMTAVRRMMR